MLPEGGEGGSTAALRSGVEERKTHEMEARAKVKEERWKEKCKVNV